MFLESLLPILLITAGALAVIGMLRRIMMWRRGQAESVALLSGLAAMPRRYLVDLHHVVARDKVMSNTHVATAGGFVLSVVLIFAVHVFNLEPQILSWVLLGSLGLMFCGALFVAKRRLNPPSRLSKGPWMRLPKSLIMFSVSFSL